MGLAILKCHVLVVNSKCSLRGVYFGKFYSFPHPYIKTHFKRFVVLPNFLLLWVNNYTFSSKKGKLSPKMR